MREEAFTLASGEKVHVPFMVQAEQLRHAEKDGAQAVKLKLPYEGGRFSMVVVLPAEGAPAAVPAGLVEALEGRMVSVQRPRFTFESAFRLEETLQAMGIKAAFGPGADFSGMNGGDDARTRRSSRSTRRARRRRQQPSRRWRSRGHGGRSRSSARTARSSS
jgi:serine protease inhibitor